MCIKCIELNNCNRGIYNLHMYYMCRNTGILDVWEIMVRVFGGGGGEVQQAMKKWTNGI